MASTTTQKDTWSASEYNNTASFVYSDAFVQPVLDLLQPHEGERIVDFGCGSGEITRALMKVVGPNGLVLGLDASENMISKAKENGVTHCRVMDLQVLEEPGSQVISADLILEPNSFDAVFSNAALHWCKSSPEAVIKNAWNALKPGGRFAVEMGGFGNLVGLRSSIYRVLSAHGHNPAALDPWFFPSEVTYRKLLEKAGFQVETIGLFPRMTYVPNGLKAWIALFARQTMLSGLNDEEAKRVVDEVVEECETDMKDAEGRWFIMYVRLRFKAVKPTN